MHKAVIIDDENKAIKSLEIIINQYCENIEIVGTANSAIEGIKIIHRLNPEIVFLDIEMPHGNGFDVLDAIPDRDFEVIFVTAYNQHAIRAFKYSAFDYILKPIDIDEILKSVERIEEKIKNKLHPNYQVLKENLESETTKKLTFQTTEGYNFIVVEDIYFIESDRNYSLIYNEKNEKIIVTKTLSDIETLLIDSNFCRCHKSYLINLNHIKRYIKGDSGGNVELTNNKKVPVSRRKKEVLLKKIGK